MYTGSKTLDKNQKDEIIQLIEITETLMQNCKVIRNVLISYCNRNQKHS